MKPSFQFDLYHIKKPQLIGIVAGCIVFVITICVVIYLLVASGTFGRFIKEIQAESGSLNTDDSENKKNLSPQQDQLPQLYDHLLRASRELPSKPNPPPLMGRNILIRQFRKSEDLDALNKCSNGTAIFSESAYDLHRIWGWLLELEIDPKQSNPVNQYLTEHNADSTHLTIIDVVLNAPVGMISLLNNMSNNLSVQLGGLWLTPSYQGKKISHECMFLVLSWLFNAGYRRVTFEVDVRHMIGRKFLERCGFKLEAVLRKHRIIQGRNRDTALYVILNSEWSEVEVRLKRYLGIPLREVKRVAEILQEKKKDEDSIGALSVAKKRKNKKKKGSIKPEL